MKEVSTYEASTDWNGGIPCNYFQNTDTIVIDFYFSILWLTVSKRVSKKTYWGVKWKRFRPMRHIRPEIGEFFSFFKILIQLYFYFFSLFFDFLYQRRYHRQYLNIKFKKVLAYDEAMAWNRRIHSQTLKSLIKMYFFVSWFTVLLTESKSSSKQITYYVDLKWMLWYFLNNHE